MRHLQELLQFGPTPASRLSLRRKLAEVVRPVFLRGSRATLMAHCFGWRHPLLLQEIIGQCDGSFEQLAGSPSSVLWQQRCSLKDEVNLFDHVLEGMK